jgi:homoserine kinase type II
MKKNWHSCFCSCKERFLNRATIRQMETDTLLLEAASFFDIGSIKNTEPVLRAMANQNFFVSTTEGEYVLRILRTQKLEGLQAEHAIEEQLDKAGILVPHLMKGGNGEPYCEVDGRVVTCTKRIAGERPAHATSTIAFQIGETLATFQRVVVEVPGYANFWLKKEAAYREIARFDKSELAQRITARVKEYECVFEMDLPKGFVHGDLHLGNLIVTPNGKLAVFDFESTERDILLLDLGITALSFYNDDGVADPALIQSLFEGYESVRKLTNREKQNFKTACMYLSAAAASWVYNEGYPHYAEGFLAAGDTISTFQI